MDYVLKTHNLTKCFNGREVVSNINLNIKKGEIYGFLGINGAGKSTVMKLIMNLIQPDAGTVEIFGKDSIRDSKEILKRIGTLIEYPIFYENLTAMENMELHCEYMGYHNKDSIMEALKLVNLHGIENKAVGHFSLGMKQRLALARAIVTKPEFLVLDEPINGLDVDGIVQMRDLFKILNNEYGITIMISSHILSEIEQVADTIGVIHKGKLIKEVEMETIHETKNQYIEIETKNIKGALVVLESKLGIRNMKMINDNILRIYDEYAVGIITKEFATADVEITSITQKKTSLEEYFLMLTKGGEVHV